MGSILLQVQEIFTIIKNNSVVCVVKLIYLKMPQKVMSLLCKRKTGNCLKLLWSSKKTWTLLSNEKKKIEKTNKSKVEV